MDVETLILELISGNLVLLLVAALSLSRTRRCASPLLLLVTTTLTCMLSEALFCRLAGRASSLGDWSIVITGLLLGQTTKVFSQHVDAAEEEEFMEAVLAYFFLLTENRPMQKAELDGLIEKWLETGWHCKINFEIEDAVNKLERLELVTREGDMVQCLQLAEAKGRLDHIWDNYFTFSSH